jgi:hypothetical protein
MNPQASCRSGGSNRSVHMNRHRDRCRGAPVPAGAGGGGSGGCGSRWGKPGAIAVVRLGQGVAGNSEEQQIDVLAVLAVGASTPPGESRFEPRVQRLGGLAPILIDARQRYGQCIGLPSAPSCSPTEPSHDPRVKRVVQGHVAAPRCVAPSRLGQGSAESRSTRRVRRHQGDSSTPKPSVRSSRVLIAPSTRHPPAGYDRSRGTMPVTRDR